MTGNHDRVVLVDGNVVRVCDFGPGELGVAIAQRRVKRIEHACYVDVSKVGAAPFRPATGKPLSPSQAACLSGDAP